MKKVSLNDPIVSTVCAKQLSFPRLNINPLEISLISLSYVAGVIDGDGSINVTFGSSATGRPRFRALIQLRMTNPNPPMLCQKLFGGWISCSPPRGKEHKPSYGWALSGQKLRHVLLRLLPFLSVKKHCAENALDFLYNQFLYNQERLHRKTKEARYYTKRALNDLMTYSVRSRELNRRAYDA